MIFLSLISNLPSPRQESDNFLPPPFPSDSPPIPTQHIMPLCAYSAPLLCSHLQTMPFFFDFNICKVLLHAFGDTEFGIFAWPLSILMLLSHYQFYIHTTFATYISIAFFI